MPDLEKAIKGLQIERECVSRDCDRNCGICDLVQEKEWLLSVYDDAISLLKAQEEQIKKRDESLEKARKEIKWVRGMLEKQEAEIAFLKAMQLQTAHNMSNEDIGNAVRNVFEIVR